MGSKIYRDLIFFVSEKPQNINPLFLLAQDIVDCFFYLNIFCNFILVTTKNLSSSQGKHGSDTNLRYYPGIFCNICGLHYDPAARGNAFHLF